MHASEKHSIVYAPVQIEPLTIPRHDLTATSNHLGKKLPHEEVKDQTRHRVTISWTPKRLHGYLDEHNESSEMTSGRRSLF